MLPRVSGNGIVQGSIVLGGGILPTLMLGGLIYGYTKGVGLGGSATVGIGGNVLPTAAFGGGVAGAVSQLIVNGAASATALEDGWLNGFVPAMNNGASVGGEIGVLLSKGIHAVLGWNGGGWDTIRYGGHFIPTSTLAINIGGDFGFEASNAKTTSTAPP
ncbi:hypothetical protein GQ54DRAFT_303251 [Martensiomyces pterosporus]|nr:hypothetical protein GQ54DRAFT_303251 [Martensiomyces pterosporus]